MERQHIHSRYVELCKKHGISVSVTNINTADAPAYEIKSNDLSRSIVLNDAKITASEYESYLAYAVSLLILPRLVLKTERLIIRRFCMDDAHACFTFMSDAHGMYMDGCKPFTSMDDTFWERMRLFEKREGQYVIILKSTNEVIGTINVFDDDSRAVMTKEIGYAVAPEHQRQGYAYEAISSMIDLLRKDLLFDMVVAGVLPENTPSARLLEKLGFSSEGTRHKTLWHEGLNKPVDLIYYYID